MLKRDITFEDFDGEERTETFYFNITKTELMELEVSRREGMKVFLENIVKAENNKELLAQFKNIVLMSYGEKSEDGKRFIKSEELSIGFTQMPAFDALFMELTTDEDAAATFISGILPKGLTDEATNVIAKMEAAKVVEIPPTPPTV